MDRQTFATESETTSNNGGTERAHWTAATDRTEARARVPQHIRGKSGPKGKGVLEKVKEKRLGRPTRYSSYTNYPTITIAMVAPLPPTIVLEERP